MKVACVWGEARSLDRISFRHEHLIAGFRALGHEPFLVTARDLVGRYDGPLDAVDDLAELARPESWNRRAYDCAVAVTWLGMVPLLRALEAAGVPRVAIADSDGQLGYAAHPGAAWQRLYPKQTTLRERVRAVRYFARRYVAGRARRDEEDLRYVASAAHSSRIAFGSSEAIACWRRFLRQQGAEALAERAFVAPFPVPEEFCDAPPVAKEDRVVAIGRWSDPQKDAPLLAAALERFLARGRATRVQIFGADGAAAFGDLAGRFPALEIAGIQEPPVVRVALAASRVVLFASRWETGPHAAGEALVSGATLVSPPMPNFSGWTAGGAFGEVSANRSARALADALGAELGRWDRGERDAAAIATRWRERLHPRAFAAALAASLAG
ncbi:MAG: hypothetical protein AB7G12_16195 [Thermoanaerobaculia bacterium]